MTAVIVFGLTWMVLALPAAMLIGRGIRMGDEAAEAPFRTDSVERYLAEQAPAPLS
jgi:hypothetical protein